MGTFVVRILFAFLVTGPRALHGFLVDPSSSTTTTGRRRLQSLSILPNINLEDNGASIARRQLVQSVLSVTLFTSVWTADVTASPAFAAERQSLDAVLYRIMRVKEAVQQETRLIKSGKFKDVQRANVKLAVKFIINNYRLNDAFVTASAYLDSNDRRVEAGQVGQAVVQNLYTILEYFDSSDVQNIKVGQDGMGGKEQLVVKGLDATRKQIDDFLAYFPRSDVDQVLARIAEENLLNMKEFDPSLGDILNLAPP